MLFPLSKSLTNSSTRSLQCSAEFAKLSIPLAILGKINPAAAVITTIGGLAMSKRLTNKERALLLDDIEVEIEVLDKEISMAESKNQMKKLRALINNTRRG